MRDQQRQLNVDLSRYGDDATYVILGDGRALVFHVCDDQNIRAHIIDANGQEHNESPAAAMRELRSWVEQHREH
jgi:hypothetical protein